MNLLRWTLSFLRPYRAHVAAITALSVVEVALGALAPWPLKIVIDSVLGAEPLPAFVATARDRVLGPNPIALLATVVVAGLVLQLLLELALMWHTQLQVTTGQRIVYDLRRRLLDHLLALGLRHHLVTRTADSVYRLESDAYCVNDLAIGGVFPLGVSALKLTVMFAILVQLDLALALLSLAVVPFLYASLRYYSTRMVDRADKVKQAESSLIERMFEVLSSVRVVKSFAREAHEIGQFTAVGDETMAARLRLTWQESLFGIALSVITLIGTALILVVGGMHVLDGRLTVGSLLVVLAYLAAVYTPLSSIAHTAGTLQQAVASARRVREVFALIPEAGDPAAGLDAGAVAGELRFDEVSFAYEAERPILDRISFLARPGELVALVGLTGAGKSTLASLIPRFFEPTGGRVLLDGVDVRAYALEIAARAGRAGAAGAGALRHDHRRQHPVRPPERHRRGGRGRGRGRARGPLHRAPAARLRHATRRGRRDALGRRAAAPQHRARPAQECPASWCSTSPPRRSTPSRRRPSSARSAASGPAGPRSSSPIGCRPSAMPIASWSCTKGRLVAQGTHDALVAGNDLYRRMCARLALGRSLDEAVSVDEVMHAL